MLDYGFNFMNTKIFIDNESTIYIVKNPVFHSKTKHIEIRHHFIRDCYKKKLIQVIKIHTDYNVADLLIMDFDVSSTARISLEPKKPIIVPLSYQPKKTHKPRKAIRTTEISQSSGPINLVAYKTVYKEWEDRMERAATTASSYDAEQDSDAQTRFETASKQSNDPPLSRGYILGSREDSMKLLELMKLCTKLSNLFWATTKIKTVNEEHQIQALVDKKKVIITESSIRSDLHLEDADGTDCLPTTTIFEELARMGAKTTAWNKFSSTMASAIICLATNQNLICPIPHPSDSTADVPNEESVPTHSNDPMLNGEDRLKLIDLMDMCTKLSEKVLDLEHTKTNQAQEITNLKLRVKKLEKKIGLRTHKFKRLYKEDAFNQGRSIKDIEKDVEVSLVDETQGRSDDAKMFDTYALIGNEVFAENDMIEKDQDVIPKEVSTAAPSNTAVSPPVITEVEITLAQTLAKLKSANLNAGESTTRTPISVSSSSIKDKGKAKMDEPEVPLKKKDQIALDEEMARNLEAQIQAELIEEERLIRKKEKEANIALIES
ncbi:hypothetical protein Tco_0933635 [Tanacetum coccineum]